MDLLARGAPELGLSLDADQLAHFETYYRELADWNGRTNLTSVIQYEEVQVKHFLDSLTVLPAIGSSLATNSRVVDVGAGAGFPGLPLKLVWPDIHLTLVESTGKKATFLRHMVEILDLPETEVRTGRAEELAHYPDLRGSYDLALARGLARLPTLLEYTLPFTCRGGTVAAWKHGGDGLRAELDSARRALQTLGGRVKSIYPVKATGLDDNRVVVTIEKVKETPEEYPRRPGVPRKQPL
jgi:16S rRNA (guanine527-N7)-methyltransferase